MSLDEKEIDILKSQILQMYRSVSVPRFDFVMRAIKNNPYAFIAEKIKEIGAVTEDTDENNDVSFGYSICPLGDHYYVRISMIGAYAFIMNLSKNELVVNEKQCKDLAGKCLVRVLVDGGIHILDADDLMHQVPLQITNRRTTNIFQALFSDSDFFPWESS